MTGVLLPAEISIIRRGTHTLTLPGGAWYYVESKVVNLIRFAGHSVSVRGVFERNADSSAPPVLVVESITSPVVTKTETGGTLQSRSGAVIGEQGSSMRLTVNHTPLLRAGTGSLSNGAPCGGTAGILCPHGQYCAVTDRESNSGRCRKL